MTRHPFDSDELGRNDPEMDRIGSRLERYASDVGDEPPIDLAVRIRVALDDEPVPATGWWASLLAILVGWHGPARLVMATAVLLAAVLGAVALGDLADWARERTGSSPDPSEIIAPSPTPTPTPTLTPTPTVTPSPSPSPTSSASDDDDRVETPEPSESDDNSGPGGGDNSGPGGGGGD